MGNKVYDKVKLIAHRGLSSKYMANTLPAFYSACKLPFFGVETDIQFTKDGKIVCFHDASLKHEYGIKKRVADFSLKQLVNLSRLHHGEDGKMCTFVKYLRVCKKYSKACVIEIKGEPDVNQIRKLLNIIKFHRYLKHCIIISFNPIVLQRVRKKNKRVQLQLLIRNPIRRYTSFCVENKVDVSLYSRLVSADVVRKMHSLQLNVGAYTINDEKTANKCCEMGIDYITSDIIM